LKESGTLEQERTLLSERLKKFKIPSKGSCSFQQGFLVEVEKIEMLLYLGLDGLWDQDPRSMDVSVIKIGIKMSEPGPVIPLHQDQAILVLEVVDRFIQLDCNMAATGGPAIGLNVEVVQGVVGDRRLGNNQKDDRSPRKRSRSHAGLLLVSLLNQVEGILVAGQNVFKEGLILDLSNWYGGSLEPLADTKIGRGF